MTEATRPSELEAMKNQAGHDWKSIGDRTLLFDELESLEATQPAADEGNRMELEG